MSRSYCLVAIYAFLALTTQAQVPLVAGDVSPRTQINSVSVDPDKPASIPLTLAGYQPLVEVSVDGKPAGKFLIATGWARTTIFSTAAESLGLTAYDFSTVRDTPHLGHRLYNARTLSFGAAEIELEGLWTEPGVRTQSITGSPISGIIGWDVLRELSFTISASAGTLELHAAGLPATVKGTTYKMTGAWDQFPVLEVNGLASDAPLPLLLDTAVDLSLYLSDKALRATSDNSLKRVAVQAPNVGTGKSLTLSDVYRTTSNSWAPVAPAAGVVHVGPRPAPLFRFGAVGLIGNGTLARCDISLDHVAHSCTFGEPAPPAKATPPGGLQEAPPATVRKVALAYLIPDLAQSSLASLKSPSFVDLGPSVAWSEDTGFASAIGLLDELSPQHFGDLVDRCSAIDDTTGLQALLAWAKKHDLDTQPWLSSTITGAALGGSNGILQILNRELGSITFVGPDGFSALHYACSGGHVDTIRFCLDAKIPATLAGPAGLQPIELLGPEGTAEGFDLLVARGASVRKPRSGINLAVSAAESENSPIVKKAVAAGFDPNWKAGDDRVTPLMMAAYNGDTDLVKFLVKNGADPELEDNNGETALYYAIRGTGSAETYQALLDAGAPTDTTSFEHGTLAEAISAYASPELLALTLAASDGKAHTSPFGTAPVATAARRGHFELIKALVAAGFDPTREDTDGIAPLEWCAIGNNPGVAAYLLSQKEKFSPKPRTIARALQRAALWGNGDVFLILAGAATSDEVKEIVDPQHLLKNAVLGNNTNVLSLITAKRLAPLPADTSALQAEAEAVGAIYTAAALAQ